VKGLVGRVRDQGSKGRQMQIRVLDDKIDDTYVLGPALAMESKKGLLWVSLKFSSANFSP